MAPSWIHALDGHYSLNNLLEQDSASLGRSDLSLNHGQQVILIATFVDECSQHSSCVLEKFRWTVEFYDSSSIEDHLLDR